MAHRRCLHERQARPDGTTKISDKIILESRTSSPFCRGPTEEEATAALVVSRGARGALRRWVQPALSKRDEVARAKASIVFSGNSIEGWIVGGP